MIAKYKREAESMSGELSRKAAKLEKRIAVTRGGGNLTTAMLNEAQALASLARDIELSIMVAIEARRELAKIRKGEA